MKILAQLYVRKIRRLERRVGYRLVFPRLSDTWINAFMYVDLTRAWKKYGLNETGVDYWTMGAVENGISSRFDPQSKQYQSWLGGYLVKSSAPRHWTLQDHFSLAVVDQLDWLRDYGDPHPVCELHPSGFVMRGEVKVGSYTGTLYEGGGISHTDIGPGKQRRILLHLQMAFVAAVLNLTPGIHVTGKNLSLQSLTRHMIRYFSRAISSLSR
jgi:hypothetical protein